MWCCELFVSPLSLLPPPSFPLSHAGSYGGADAINPYKVVRGGSAQSQYGEFVFADLIGHPYGQRFFSAKGLTGFVYPLRASPELLTSGGLAHRTQLVHSSDASYITLALQLRAGLVVVEAGTGSGSLTNALARIAGPAGHVFTFEFHAERAQQAREAFADIGNAAGITVTHRDVCEDGFECEGLAAGGADAVFLDLPAPWTALDHAKSILRAGRAICCYSPCLEQVMRTCAGLRERGFEDVETVEVRQHPYDSTLLSRAAWNFDAAVDAPPVGGRRQNVRPQINDPDTMLLLRPRPGETPGHTAFLTVAKKPLPMPE